MVDKNYTNSILHYFKLNIIVILAIQLSIASVNSKLNFLSDFDSITTSTDNNLKFHISHPIEKVFTTELAQYFLNFAGFGYCTISEMEDRTCCPDIIDVEGWEVIAKEAIEFGNYNFALLKNDNNKKIVITFPGTRGKYQFLEEIFYSNGVPLENDLKEKVMNYFKQIWVSIKSVIGDKMKKLYEEHPDYQFLFTGHSLGAAIATIAALDSVKYENLKRTESSPVLITYGQPRTGNDYFANEVMNHVPIIYRIVRQGDFIATYPLCAKDTQTNTCLSNLPDSKFSKDLQLSEEQINAEENNYYSWHLGNLILYSNDMTSFVDCSNEFGDNNPKDDCILTLSYNFYHHLIYFDKFISRMCRR